MRRWLYWLIGTPLSRRIALVLVLLAVAIASLAFTQFRLNILGFDLVRENDGPLGLRLGLDLQGGIHLVYQAATEGDVTPTQEQLEGVRQIIVRRINPLGVSEPVIQIMGDDRVLVQLPGIEDEEQVKQLIGETAQLNFRIRTINADGTAEDGPVLLTGDDLARAYAGTHPQTGEPIVNLEFNRRGAEVFADATAQIANAPNKRLAIFLDEEELVSPTADEAILGGRAFIRGPGFDQERVQQIAIQLESGRLPVPLELVQEWDVNATLGSDSLAKSLAAGAVGFALVALFMVLYYRLPGLLAGVALAFYTVLVLAIFKLFNVTLTISGIAALILSIGMAVDANILIFERMKEELRSGRTLRASLEVGFNRAWTAIRDSNVSTLITCVILIWFGSRLAASLVLGFALTLAIGILVSMFTAIFVTKTLLQLVTISQAWHRLRLYVAGENLRAATQRQQALGERS